MKKLKTLLVLAVVSLAGINVKAQMFSPYSLTSCNQIYTETFNSLGISQDGTAGTATAPYNVPGATGWHAIKPGVTNSYTWDNGVSYNTRGVRNYYSPTSVDYSLGYYDNSTAANSFLGLLFINNTGAPISSLNVTYTGEQWRRGNNASIANITTFDYQKSSTGFTSMTAGTWTPVASLNFTAPQNSTICGGATALDGNLPANRRTMTATITLTSPLLPGEQIMLRWKDNNYNCDDHGWSIDDVSIKFNSAMPVAGNFFGPTTVCGPDPMMMANNTYDFSVNGNYGTVTITDQFGADITGLFTIALPNIDVNSDNLGGVTSFTIKNTVNNPCGQPSVSTHTVNVAPAPVGGFIVDNGSACNVVNLTLVGYDNQVLRWEYSTDYGASWLTINNTSPNLTYIANQNDIFFRTIVTRSTGMGGNLSCYEVESGWYLYDDFVVRPTMTVTTNTECSGGSITVTDNDVTTDYSYSISPDPNRNGVLFGNTVTFPNLPAGTYTIILINGECSVNQTVTLGSNPTAMPVMRGTPYTSSRTSITPEWFAYRGASSYTLQWRPNGSTTWNTISGITSTRRAVTGLLCSNFYQFRVRAICSNGTASPYSLISTFSTLGCAREGISSDLTASDLSLYPNPNNGNFNLNFVAEGTGAATLFVADITGKTVANQTITLTEGENNIPVSLDGVAPGIYLVRFTVGENTFTQKVIVE